MTTGPANLLTAPRRVSREHDEFGQRFADATCRVWIDQDLCTGDGLCEDICADVFVMLDDGIAYVREADHVFNELGQSMGQARVAPANESAVIAAALDCPGECIFIETTA